MAVNTSGATIHMLPFTSRFGNSSGIGNDNRTAIDDFYNINDEDIIENKEFRYPVFVPGTGKKYKRAILLLHGLNERSWLKYLPWGYYLAIKTGVPVILFPIAFHMNRSPQMWSNPRAVMPLLIRRNHSVARASMTTIANVALSERLSEDPLRFMLSGWQSAEDVICLLEQTKSGKHPFLEKNADIDLFTYSIGSFLGQILMLANPANLLQQSRMFLFCGGSLFSQMNGVSRLIMDETAFRKIYHFYMCDLQTQIRQRHPFFVHLQQTSLGNAFISMIRESNRRTFREHTIAKLHDKIQAICLKNDSVIPATGIIQTLGIHGKPPFCNVEVFDPPFPYSHETPFPVANPGLSPLVDTAFAHVFEKASGFLN